MGEGLSKKEKGLMDLECGDCGGRGWRERGLNGNGKIQ